MKRFVLTTVLTLASLIGFAQTTKGPAITLINNFHDFGMIEEGLDYLIVFPFTNSGDKPLIIHNVMAQGTPQLITQFAREEIMPGQNKEIMVTLNTRGMKDGLFEKKLTIESNSTGKPLTIGIKAMIKPNTQIKQSQDPNLAPPGSTRDAQAPAGTIMAPDVPPVHPAPTQVAPAPIKKKAPKKATSAKPAPKR